MSERSKYVTRTFNAGKAGEVALDADGLDYIRVVYQALVLHLLENLPSEGASRPTADTEVE